MSNISKRFEYTAVHDIPFDVTPYRQHVARIKSHDKRFYVEVQNNAVNPNEKNSIPFTFHLDTFLAFLRAAPLVVECLKKLVSETQTKEEVTASSKSAQIFHRMPPSSFLILIFI